MLPLLAVIFSWVWQQWQFFLTWLKRTMIDNNTRGAWLAIISTVLYYTITLYKIENEGSGILWVACLTLGITVKRVQLFSAGNFS